MKSYFSLGPAMVAGAVLVAAPVSGLQAAELQVLAGGAMTAPLKELATQFEGTSGHKLVFRFGTTPELIKLATTGGAFDLGIVPREVYKDAGAQGHFAAGTPTDIARVGLGIAVRSGAHKPDISTPDALKQTLLRAQSIATIPASAAGAQVLEHLKLLASARR
ncbi:MAG: substrate-binding domain-containing protein [Xanthobacteraceae bacterium]